MTLKYILLKDTQYLYTYPLFPFARTRNNKEVRALSTVNTATENQFKLSIPILLIKQDRGMLVVINRTSSCSLHEFFAGAYPAGFRFKENRRRIGADVDAGEARLAISPAFISRLVYRAWSITPPGRI